MKWQAILADHSDRVRPHPGCAPEKLADAELALGVRLPSDLRDFLLEADGFYDAEGHYDYAWDIQTVVVSNTLHWRETGLRLDDDLLAFGADGSSAGAFCLALGDSDRSVYHWSWIASERRQIAPDPQRILDRVARRNDYRVGAQASFPNTRATELAYARRRLALFSTVPGLVRRRLGHIKPSRVLSSPSLRSRSSSCA